MPHFWQVFHVLSKLPTSQMGRALVQPRSIPVSLWSVCKQQVGKQQLSNTGHAYSMSVHHSQGRDPTSLLPPPSPSSCLAEGETHVEAVHTHVGVCLGGCRRELLPDFLVVCAHAIVADLGRSAHSVVEAPLQESHDVCVGAQGAGLKAPAGTSARAHRRKEPPRGATKRSQHSPG